MKTIPAILKLCSAAIVLLCSAMPFAQAEEGAAGDWLIERRLGQWQLVSKGLRGRVEKKAPNQEVLRLGEGGVVLVLSMPALENGVAYCTRREREDYRVPCSSAFLECQPEPAGAALTLVATAFGYNVADSRNRLQCRMDENGILRAAHSVGLISHILPAAQ